jgi:hypothetical protein
MFSCLWCRGHAFPALQEAQGAAGAAVTPNPSLKRSANGRPPGPGLGYAVHYPSPGPGVLPLSPA